MGYVMRALMVLPVLLCFFGVCLIILPARLLACICGGSLFSFSKVLFAFLSSRVLLGFWGGLSLLAQVLHGFCGGFLVFAFSFLEVVLSSDGLCLSGIFTLSNVNFFWRSTRVVIALEVMSSKIPGPLT